MVRFICCLLELDHKTLAKSKFWVGWTAKRIKGPDWCRLLSCWILQVRQVSCTLIVNERISFAVYWKYWISLRVSKLCKEEVILLWTNYIFIWKLSLLFSYSSTWGTQSKATNTKVFWRGGKKSINIYIGAATQTVKQTGSCWTATVVGLGKANIGLRGLGGALWISCERGSFRVLSAHRLRPSLLDNLLSRPRDRVPQRDTTKPNKQRFRTPVPPPLTFHVLELRYCEVIL